MACRVGFFDLARTLGRLQDDSVEGDVRFRLETRQALYETRRKPLDQGVQFGLLVIRLRVLNGRGVVHTCRAGHVNVAAFIDRKCFRLIAASVSIVASHPSQTAVSPILHDGVVGAGFVAAI